MAEAEIGVMQLQAKERQRTAGRGEEGVRPESEDMALVTPGFWISSLQDHETLNCWCFEPPCLWYFVTGA